MVKVAPWQPSSEAFDIATPETVNETEPFAGTVCAVACVVYETPVVTQAGWPVSATAAPLALTEVIDTGNGFGLFTVR